MDHFLLPPSLSGFSFRERNKLRELNWKNGKIADIENGDYSFILVSGQLYDEQKVFHDPAREILGIKPFFKNIKKKYYSETIHNIYYIETRELARFFLETPKAMQSYILYETNAGANTGIETLEPWKKFPRVWTIVSLQSGWQGIHFAFTAAAYLANTKNERTVYLEMNTSGLSIFSFIEAEPVPPPMMHVQENENSDPDAMLYDRTLLYENVDIINVQHLSQWKINPDQWVTFYNNLSQRYDNIILHCGEDLEEFFHEYSDGLFIFRKYHTMDYPGLHPGENNELWPPTMQIFTTSLPQKNDNEIKYPLFYKNVINLEEIPFYNNIDESYWQWFENYPGKLFNQRRAIILGDCFPSMLDAGNYLKQIFKEGEDIKSFLSNNFVIAEGATALMISLLVIARYNPPNVKKIFKKITPVYPRSGFYSYRSFVELLEKYFKEISQDFLHLNFSTFSGNEVALQWFTHGVLPESLAASIFPPLCLEPTGQKKVIRDFYASNKSKWHEHIALAFRYGFQNVEFFEFILPENIAPTVFAEKVLLSYSQAANHVNLTGQLTKHFTVFQK
ncbi:MAG: hypothetical protein OEV66_10160 [Spirochaetia bacterium]|nr:hypothetical protein [Spirochaetia bacterium]